MTRATRSFKFDQLLKRVKRLQEIVMVLSQSSLLWNKNRNREPLTWIQQYLQINYLY